jgi:hypothetical protein
MAEDDAGLAAGIILSEKKHARQLTGSLCMSIVNIVQVEYMPEQKENLYAGCI